MSTKKTEVLRINKLTVRFNTKKGVVHANEDISLSLNKGEMLGVVGESGSGKSVLCNTIIGLLPRPPAIIENGEIFFKSKNNTNEAIDLLKCSKKTLRKIRGKSISMIFQDPMISLNPYLSVGRQMSEIIELHGSDQDKKNCQKIIIDTLHLLKLNKPEEIINNFPHELSGGMKQRVMIAMSLLGNPDLILADEPTTALDVTVQAEVLKLFRGIQKQIGTSVIFITHDLTLASQYCDRIAVMYAGKIVETGLTAEVLHYPCHPYTQLLLQCLPSMQKRGKELTSIPGAVPDLLTEMKGFSFALRYGISDDNPLVKSQSIIEKKSDTHFFEKCPEEFLKILKKK